jgi:hypothetical protein
MYDDHTDVDVQARSARCMPTKTDNSNSWLYGRQIWPIHIHEQVIMNTKDSK